MTFSLLEISTTRAEDLARKYFGIKGTAKKLPGEVDFNFYLKSEDGKEYTLKVSRPDTDPQSIDFQSSIMRQLALSGIPLDVPEVIPALDGSTYVELENQRFLRLQKWVPGRVLGP